MAGRVLCQLGYYAAQSRLGEDGLRVKRVFLIPDTNFFMQCETLDQITWGDIPGAFDEVVVVITKPVANEIDKHKNQGKGRLQARAKLANSKYLAPLLETTEVVVREKGVRVTVVLDLATRPTAALSGELNFDEADDKLVGTAHAFAVAHAGETVRFLSNDTPALHTARAHGLEILRTPPDWFLKEENDERDKALAEKTAELERLRNLMPRIKAAFELPDETVITAYEAQRDYFPPLTKADIAAFVAQLKQRHPMATDYGDREPKRKPVSGIAGSLGMMEHRYVPATDDEIRRYMQADYPAWLDEIEESLASLHTRLEHQQPIERVIFSVENHGTQPARDALITFAAEGDLFIMPPPPKKDDDSASPKEPRPLVPRPPTPPKGVWTHGVGHVLDIYSLAQQHADFLRPPLPSIHPGLLKAQSQRDANEFFYKKRPIMPVQEFELECAQWRHGDGRSFSCQLHVPATGNETRAVLLVTVQAENLVDPLPAGLPVKIQRVQRDTVAQAQALIDKLG